MLSNQGIRYAIPDDFDLVEEQGGDFFGGPDEFEVVVVATPGDFSAAAQLIAFVKGIAHGLGVDPDSISLSEGFVRRESAQVLKVAPGGFKAPIPPGHSGRFVVWELPNKEHVIVVGGIAGAGQAAELDRMTDAIANSVR